MSYQDAIQFLYSLRLFGTKLGLDNSFRLSALAGDPHQRLRFIHVAGTNGKGSTCAMLESIYRRAGLRVGLFSSPHLVSFRERIQVDRQLISEADVVRLVEDEQRALDTFPEDRHPTFFEVVMVMALRYFVERGCDLVIWETGLGGRLDATNIVRPLASVITNIQFDHERWLGSTLAQIAAEKAGIIKTGIPILTATSEPEALEVIRAQSAQAQAPLTCVTRAVADSLAVDRIRLPLLGGHQKLNAALACATTRVLGRQLPIDPGAVRAGLEAVRWPGRFQKHVTHDGRIVLLDGAHNPAGAESLKSALKEHFPGQASTLILGVFQDKDWAGICRILAPVAKRVLLAPVQSERTVSPADLQREWRRIAPEQDVAVCPSLGVALEQTQDDDFVLITGSLHFVGEGLELLGLLPGPVGERGLNEWDAAAHGLNVRG